MTTFTTLSHREAYTPSELWELAQAHKGIRLATAYAKSVGHIKFAQLGTGLVLVKPASAPYWSGFSTGKVAMTEMDVMDFMGELFPHTARENVTASLKA